MVTAVVELITPEIADLMLTRNTKNRVVRQHHVNEMVRDMKAGKYQFNGDAIRFDTDGVLLDGQHRLMAISRSGVSQEMLVVRDLPPETMMTIDSGIKRTNGDRLNINGVKNGNNVAATFQILNAIARRNYNTRITPSELFDLFETHPRVEDVQSRCTSIGLSLNSVIAAFVYIGYYTGYKDHAEEFLATFRTGEKHCPGDPAFVARERIIRLKSGVQKVHRDTLIGIAATAWEAKRTGRTLKTIRPGNQASAPSAHGWRIRDLSTPMAEL